MKIAASIFLLALTLCDSAVPRESLSSKMIREAKYVTFVFFYFLFSFVFHCSMHFRLHFVLYFRRENVKAGPPDGPPDDPCGDLITKMTSPTYEACDDLGFKLVTSDFSYSDKSANDFCNNNCAKLMEDTTSQMVTQCNLPSDSNDFVSDYTLRLACRLK